MAPKSPLKTWTDAKILLAVLSIASTLGFWNVFAAKDNSQVKDVAPPPPAVSVERSPMPQVKILLGGRAPVTVRQVVYAPAEAPSNNNPAPITQTGSSR